MMDPAVSTVKTVSVSQTAAISSLNLRPDLRLVSVEGPCLVSVLRSVDAVGRLGTGIRRHGKEELAASVAIVLLEASKVCAWAWGFWGVSCWT